MQKVDFSQSANDTNNIYIGNGEETIKINKKDLVWQKLNHEHHYLPDFTDETDTYIALKCARCPHGRLQKKDSKEFTDWLDTHRAKA